MKRVLLVNPFITDFKSYDEWMRPLGLYRLGHELKKRGIEVEYLDALDRFKKSYPKSKTKAFGTGTYNCEEIEKPEIFKLVPRRYKRYGIDDNDFIERLAAIESIDLIAISSKMTYWYPGIIHTIELIKTIYPDTPIALGGIYATLCGKHAKKNIRADYFFEGAISNSMIDEIISIINFRPNNKHLECSFGSLFPNQILPYGALFTSVGCPFKCTYCASKIMRPKYEKVPIKIIFEQFEKQYNLGARHFAFYDDSLLFDFEDHLSIFLDSIEKYAETVTFHVPNGIHARYINIQVAKKLMKFNFKTIRIGLESSDPEIQKRSGGKTDNTMFEQAINHLKNHASSDVKIGAYLLIGLEGQDFSHIENDIQWLKELKVTPNLLNISPIPGTVDFERFVKEFPILAQEPLSQNDLFFNSLRISNFYSKYQKLKNIINN